MDAKIVLSTEQVGRRDGASTSSESCSALLALPGNLTTRYSTCDSQSEAQMKLREKQQGTVQATFLYSTGGEEPEMGLPK